MRFSRVFMLLAGLLTLIPPHHYPLVAANAGIYRITYHAAGRTLTVEILDDDLAHFQLSVAPMADEIIWTTPMIARTDYPGPSQPIDHRQAQIGIIQTPALRIAVDLKTLCSTITDLADTPDTVLTTLCPLQPASVPGGLTFSQEAITDIYGLGEQFTEYKGTTGNWVGHPRGAQGPFGNEINRFDGGGVGNDQFPVLYALGPGYLNYALMVDHPYALQWDFTTNPFSVRTPGPALRWYILTGSDLRDLRGDYMALTGFPPVPPKQMFGLWVSEFGYDGWDELSTILDSLRDANFPVDGFALDLQWFGGVGPQGHIGSLTWDRENFPEPEQFMSDLRAEHGAGIMVIEEPYVNQSLDDYTQIEAAGALVRQCPQPECVPVTMAKGWGIGGMIDWTNPAAGAWWHDVKRQPLIDAGVMAHWTDLGEPEDFAVESYYYGFPEQNLHAHADVHNFYNLLWSKSIYDGYLRYEVNRRPFILSRSGTSGSQRYGVSMWSGDIGSNLDSLAAHLNAQMHMSLSGIDYYGADVGGFYRHALESGANEDAMYTLWLANAALLDVPLRPHTFNLDNHVHTAPSLVGDIDSNRFNVRLRYMLSPYLYTLAHRAYLYGEPVFPPLVYYFQDDPNVRTIFRQKMIGPDMMMTIVTEYNTVTVNTYLPAGVWIDYHTHTYYGSMGEWFEVPTVNENGIFRVPIFVRANTVIPLMRVDDQTLNILGQRRNGGRSRDLVVQVFMDGQPGEFLLIEDDGETLAYQSDAVQLTRIVAVPRSDAIMVTIEPSSGDYNDSPLGRNIEVQLITNHLPFASVKLNGDPLPAFESRADFDAAERGYYMAPDGLVYAKSGEAPISIVREFQFLIRR